VTSFSISLTRQSSRDKQALDRAAKELSENALPVNG
jgi:hypothetical protein